MVDPASQAGNTPRKVREIVQPSLSRRRVASFEPRLHEPVRGLLKLPMGLSGD